MVAAAAAGAGAVPGGRGGRPAAPAAAEATTTSSSILQLRRARPPLPPRCAPDIDAVHAPNLHARTCAAAPTELAGRPLHRFMGTIGEAYVPLPRDDAVDATVAMSPYEETVSRAAAFVSHAVFLRPGPGRQLQPDVGAGQRRQAAIRIVIAVLRGTMDAQACLAEMQLPDGHPDKDPTMGRLRWALYPASHGVWDLATMTSALASLRNAAAADALERADRQLSAWLVDIIVPQANQASAASGVQQQLQPRPGNLLVCVPGHVTRVDGDRDAPTQALHTDRAPGAPQGEWVALLSLSVLTALRIAVWHMAHHAVRAMATVAEEEEARQIDRTNTFEGRVMEVDHTLAAVMHPNTVHAGYRGQPGQWGLRAHYYLAHGPISSGAEEATHYIAWTGRRVATGPAMVAKFK